MQAGPGGLPAGKISEIIGISPSSVSFHMKELTHAELAHSRNEGRFVIYSANFVTMTGLLSFLTDNCCGGNPCSPACNRACCSAADSVDKAP